MLYMQKRILTQSVKALLLSVILVLLLSVNTKAAVKCSYDEEKETLVVSGEGMLGEEDINEYQGMARKLIIEEGITEIDYYTIWYWSKLEEIYLPDSLTYIYPYAISGDYTIYANCNTVAHEALDGYAAQRISHNYVNDKCTRCGESASYVTGNVSDTVKYAFDKKTGVLTFSGNGEVSEASFLNYMLDTKSIVFEKGITGIADGTFSKYVSLASVKLSDTVEYIGDYAFEYCEQLINVELGNGVKNIGEWAFYGAAISSVTIPASVEEIYSYSFEWGTVIRYYCNSYAEEVFEDRYGKELLHQYVDDICVRCGKDVNVETGSCGSTATYVANKKTGVLTISGAGMIEESGFTYVFSDYIHTIRIEDGIEGMYSYIQFPGKVKNIYFPQNFNTPSSYNFWNVDVSALTIYCYSGSEVEHFAKNNGYNYISIFTGLRRDTDGALRFYTDDVFDSSVTGFMMCEGEFWYVKNGIVDENTEGLKYANEIWAYVSEGKIKSDYTGLVSYSQKLWYVTEGYLNKEFTGLCTYSGKNYYVSAGVVDYKAEGVKAVDDRFAYIKASVVQTGVTDLVYSDNAWWYIRKGYFDDTFVGFFDKNNATYLIVNGKIDTAAQGLKFASKTWGYVQAGKVVGNYTGLVDYNNSKWFVRRGFLDKDFNGYIAKVGVTYLVLAGKADTSKSGLFEADGIMAYLKNGVVQEEFSGFINHNSTWKYIYRGYWDKYFDGFAENTNGKIYAVHDGLTDLSLNGLHHAGLDWAFLKNGSVVADKTELVYSEGKWKYVIDGFWDELYEGYVEQNGNTYIVSNGIADLKANGLRSANEVWAYMKDGKVNVSFTGLYYSGDKWYYIDKGYWNNGYTGLILYQNTWWYVNKGCLDKEYKGLVSYNSKMYYVKDGKLAKISGFCEQGSDIYIIKDGVVDTAIYELKYYNGKWYYFRAGKVDWTYHSLAYSDNKWWYIENGELNKTFEGFFEFRGQQYYIKDGTIVK